jgi:hypothetical protein
MVMKKSYNKPAKDKVTLSFANCYGKPKVIWAAIWHPAQNLRNPLKMKLTGSADRSKIVP